MQKHVRTYYEYKKQVNGLVICDLDTISCFVLVKTKGVCELKILTNVFHFSFAFLLYIFSIWVDLQVFVKVLVNLYHS